MRKFPKNQADIWALAEQMRAGFNAHPADFPSINPGILYGKEGLYRLANINSQQARAAVLQATKAKDTKLATLKEIMRNCLKLSEVDSAGDPAKLTQIGWSPKASPVPTEAPGQPTNLHPVAEGRAMLWLAWDSPVSGGAVRNYIIECRQQPAGGEFGPWTIADSALDNEINFTDQPCRLQLEYRVKAVNINSESNPSNVVAVVL